MNEKIYYSAEDIANMLGVSMGKSYKILREMNKELSEKGFLMGTKTFAAFEGIPPECISGTAYEWQTKQLFGRYRRTGTGAI